MAIFSLKKRITILLILGILFSAIVCCSHYINPYTFVTNETITVPGLKKEYRLFFAADSHICLTDERDDPYVIQKEEIRGRLFRHWGLPGWRYFDALIKRCGKTDLIILGGDITDSAMYASLEHAGSVMASQPNPYMFYSGNHDFEYGLEYYSQKAFSEYLPRLSLLNRTGSYQVKEYDDLIIFAADDYGNRISEEALQGFREVIKAEKPVVVCLHVPLEPVTGDKTLIEKAIKLYGASPDGKSPLILGPDGCTPDTATAEFIQLLLDEKSPVVLVLAGHVHFYHKDMLNEKVVQIITGPAYKGRALDITLKGGK